MAKTVGFIGFGEVGSAFSAEAAAAGETALIWDHRFGTPAGDAKAQRARASGVTPAPSLAQLVRASEIIVSTVTPRTALQVARDLAPYLSPGQLVVDLNSAGPGDKVAMAELVAGAGARFVDGAIAGTPRLGGSHPLILLSGEAAPAAAAALPWLKTTVVGDRPGQAAVIKMCRSVVLKTLEAALWEGLLAAGAWGVADKVMDTLDRSLTNIDFRALNDYFMASGAVHAARRTDELDMAARTVAEAGLTPLVTEAARERLRWVSSLGLGLDRVPEHSHAPDVLALVAEVGGVIPAGRRPQAPLHKEESV